MKTYKIEYNDFVSKPDECITTIPPVEYDDPEGAADLGWELMEHLKALYDAEIENQGDLIMVYRREGTYDEHTEDGVLFTMRVLDEFGKPYDL